jgi:hypothetical protein
MSTFLMFCPTRNPKFLLRPDSRFQFTHPRARNLGNSSLVAAEPLFDSRLKGVTKGTVRRNAYTGSPKIRFRCPARATSNS